MKILIYGMTNARGLPLATVLRVHGRHSVVGLDLEPPPRGGHPDPEVKALESGGLSIPVAPDLGSAIREGSDLAFIATPAEHIQRALDDLAGASTIPWVLPVVIVTPIPPNMRINDHPGELVVGFAPFDFAPARATGRLLTLRRVEITCARTGVRVGLLRRAVSRAWAWVDNMIEVRELRPTRPMVSVPRVGVQ